MPNRSQIWKFAKSPFHARELARARELWTAHESTLRSQFSELARRQAADRGVHWASLEWGNQLRFARDRQSGLLTALAELVIRFEAEDLLEENENAGIPRDATAVFHFQKGLWGTGGKTLFNMNPELALARLSDQFEPAEE